MPAVLHDANMHDDVRTARASRPTPKDGHVAARMQAQRRRDTAPEIAIRRELHRRGLRYRVEVAPLPHARFRADMAFRSSRVAVFVDGCFWHGCPEHGVTPKNNRAWWIDKLTTNIDRDRRVDETLRSAGWEPVRIWEHEDPVTAADRIQRIVAQRRR
jgi:DNA mismatch endonuclease (patch repair protein)